MPGSGAGGGGNDVAGTAAANRVDGSLVLLEDAVALELLIEGEDGTLGARADVTRTAAAAIEALGLRDGDDGGRLGEGGRGGLEAVVVSSAAAAGVVVGTDGVDGSRLSDDGHCDCLCGCGNEFWRRWRRCLGSLKLGVEGSCS